MTNSSSILYISQHIPYTSIEITKEMEQSEKDNSFTSTSETNSIKEKHNLRNLIAYLKCISCSNTNDLKLCRICQKFVCDSCIKKEECNQLCKYCNKKTEYIKYKNINSLVSYVHRSFEMDVKSLSLEEENQGITDLLNEKNCKKCISHNEKILFYCFNCHKNLCGKCNSFFEKESQVHIGHNVKDYSYVKNLKYDLIINDLEYNEKNIDKIDEIIKRLYFKQKENNLNKKNYQKIIYELITKINDYYEIENEKF